VSAASARIWRIVAAGDQCTGCDARNVQRICATGHEVGGALGDASQRFRELRGHREMKTLLAALAAATADSQRSQRKAA
jgi:hypothetical protein